MTSNAGSGLSCWTLSENKIGMINQALGLAEALSCHPITIKKVHLKFPWSSLTPYFRLWKSYALSSSSDLLNPPYPDLIFACGRQAIIPSLLIKEQSQSTKVIYLQDPKISPSHFDAVICPAHDKLIGDNVIRMHGSTHRISESKLAQGKIDFEDFFHKFPSPRLGLLLGGPNSAYEMDESVAEALFQKLNLIQESYNASLFITPSRRTPKLVMEYLRKKFSTNSNVYLWNEEGENPYFGFLSYCDALIVTCDSVNMISEACSTDKPVYIYNLPGKVKKFAIFHSHLIDIKRASYFQNEINFDLKEPYNEIDGVINSLKKLLNI